VQQGTPPIGATYIRVLSDSFARFPSETLYDFDNNLINVSFLTTQPIKYLYPGTIWKLAVREGDFMRQIKIDPVLETTNFMEEQEDQMQGHKIQFQNPPLVTALGLVINTDNIPGSIGGNLNTQTKQQYPINNITQNFSTDGINGTPRIGAETRPVNTSVEIWVRIA